MLENNKQIAIEIAKIIDNKKGKDITILDVHNISNFTDYFVIAHGTSVRQVKALAEEIEDKLAEKNYILNHKEGMESMNWILLDYTDVIVHLFLEEDRYTYNIEKLWSDAEIIDFDNN